MTGATQSPVTPELRKRLGQYFSGSRLASLLVNISGVDTGGSAIDPMVGSGDMLAAVVESGIRPRALGGVEVEASALRICRERLKEVSHAETEFYLHEGNAFDPGSWSLLGAIQWDLVITNPPYVRYQLTSSASAENVILPSAQGIRDGLRECLVHLEGIDENYRNALLTLADSYSGLSDLAVPSWLLCAALVPAGGALAMVVPDTWLSRDYASPVVTLLNEFFVTELVVHDADAAWFSEALVRTTLLVARRPVVASKNSGTVKTPRRVLHASISRSASDERSLVGAAFPASSNPDAAFSKVAREWLASGDGETPKGCSFEWIVPHDTRQAGPTRTRVEAASPRLTRELDRPQERFLIIEDLGWKVGQGLRTGANAFFYTTLVSQEPGVATVSPDPRIQSDALRVPADTVRAVVRKQQDLPDGWTLVHENLPGRVLALQTFARPSDVADAPNAGTAEVAYRLVPQGLAEFIDRAELTNVGTSDKPRFIPTLSAVAPNARSYDPRRPTSYPRFWYQLPEFADRHSPDLLIPRVNYLNPRVLLNPGRSALVDANFSTLWMTRTDGIDPFAMLAILASTWARAAMETSGTVLGGGALKLEATQLRRLPLPAGVLQSASEFSSLGRSLMTGPNELNTLEQVDDLMWDSFSVGLEPARINAIVELARRCLEGRRR